MDLKTMAFVAMNLTFILSIFLALVRQGEKYVQGPHYWALGSFSICFGMAVLFFGFYSTQWMMVFGPIFIIVGIGLFINGLQAFNNRSPERRIPVLLAIILGSVDWFFVFQHELRLMAVFNAVLFSLVYFIAGCMLLRPVSKDLAFIYRVNASLFYLMAIFMAYRAVAAWSADAQVFLARSEWIIDQLTFLAFFIQQLATTLSLTLMLHYRDMQLLRDSIAFDELTGALKAKKLKDVAARVLTDTHRHGESSSLLSIDVDYLRRINAEYGRELGNEVLRELCKTIKEHARAEDITGRHEDDEFCLLLPNMSEQLAMEIAEQIRSDFELRLIVAEERNVFATVSIGVSNSEYAGFDYADLLAAAQSARYNAHELGRNRIVAHSAIYKIS